MESQCQATLPHHDFISEHNRNRNGTVGLDDISIIVMAKALNLPAVSMERLTSVNATAGRKIPDVCLLNQVEHLAFNDLL